MRTRWAVLFLVAVPIALSGPAGARSAAIHPLRGYPGAARKPAKKLTAREQAALEEGLFKLLAGLLQIGAGASDENLNRIETGTRDLARQRAAARREGIPLTPKEFQRPSPPPERDAAPIYAQLTRLLKEKPLDAKMEATASRLGSRYQYGPEDIAAARKLLADRQDVMALVHQATDRPECVFQRDWSWGSAPLFPEYSPARSAARLIKEESYLLALDGRYPEAIANQARGFRIAAHIAMDGTLMAYLISRACEAITLQGVRDILYLAGPNAEAANRVRAAVETNRPTYSLRRALQGEIMLEIGFMDECRRVGPQSLFLLSRDKSQAEARKMAAPMERTQMGRRFWKLLTDAGEADMIRKMRQALAIIQRPYPERKRLAKEWRESIEDRSMGVVGVFGAVMLPELSQVWPQVMTIRAQEEEVMTGAEALAYQARHGEWPDRLEQLDPYPPIDPFTGRPLKYRRMPDGFVIYSLGASGRDDGGQVLVQGTSAPDWKTAFRYPAPPPRPYPAPAPPPPVPVPSRPGSS